MSDFEHIKCMLGGQPRRVLAVAMATDATTRAAVARALQDGLADAVFVGARAEVEADPALAGYGPRVSVIDATDVDDAAAKAVALVRQGQADVLMKGMLNTDNLLRAVLDKQHGILPAGEVLTHLTVASIPGYPRLLVFTDAAVIPYPTDAQRDAQLRYVLALARRIGVECPRVALVHCSEKVDERHFPFTVHYRTLSDAAAAGAYGPCVVDGPLDVKTACSKAALDKKGLVSAVDGQADALIFPDIEAANAFYKTITLFAGARVGGMLCGCAAPVVLPSRGDSVDSKFDSLLAAMALCPDKNICIQ